MENKCVKDKRGREGGVRGRRREVIENVKCKM